MAKILVVEDDEHLAGSLEDWLISEHHTVDVVKTGTDADDRLRYYTYDLVVLDWDLPGMNGVEVARRLRAEARPVPRIVVVTSAGQSEAETAFAGAEVHALVLKPVSATSLAAALNEIDSAPDRVEAPPPALPAQQGAMAGRVAIPRLAATSQPMVVVGARVERSAPRTRVAAAVVVPAAPAARAPPRAARAACPRRLPTARGGRA